MNLGQILGWVAFAASLATALSYMAAMGGRDEALRPARVAYRIQWLALLGATAFLWYILFTHQFQYQYVASYSSLAMPAQYVYAAFWGGLRPQRGSALPPPPPHPLRHPQLPAPACGSGRWLSGCRRRGAVV